ncbi:MAG: hypothetical protein CMN77_16975 [Spirochaetaceae bacterium]|nr:hypothetical protein [Spirochaetaceae bacterium]|tara:strand:+ start:10597 stop:10923 length:327 start_codon:yes stop_codon:yes gene_type:complete
MKKFIKILIIALAISLIAGSAWAVANWKHLSSFPHIISSFYSKEFCSCYFVVGRSEAFCHNYARQYVPISEFVLNEEEKSVTVTGLGISTTSVFESIAYGCRIQGTVQ